MFALHSVGETVADLRVRKRDQRPPIPPSPDFRARKRRRNSGDPGGPSLRWLRRSGGERRVLTVWKVSLVTSLRQTSSHRASRTSPGKPPPQPALTCEKNDAPFVSRNEAICAARSLSDPRSGEIPVGGMSSGSASVR